MKRWENLPADPSLRDYVLKAIQSFPPNMSFKNSIHTLIGLIGHSHTSKQLTAYYSAMKKKHADTHWKPQLKAFMEEFTDTLERGPDRVQRANKNFHERVQGPNETAFVYITELKELWDKTGNDVDTSNFFNTQFFNGLRKTPFRDKVVCRGNSFKTFNELEQLAINNWSLEEFESDEEMSRSFRKSKGSLRLMSVPPELEPTQFNEQESHITVKSKQQKYERPGSRHSPDSDLHQSHTLRRKQKAGSKHEESDSPPPSSDEDDAPLESTKKSPRRTERKIPRKKARAKAAL